MTQRAQIVTFYLTCPEKRARLVIKSDTQESHVLEMWQGYPNHWSASAWLVPGKYRCRYYCGEGENVIYYGAAHLIGGVDEGMDGLVSVELPGDNMTSHSINILLVDENMTNLLALEALLERDGYVVHVAEGYQTAMDVAKRNRLDFAVCDVNLWDGDGCDLLKDLRQVQPLQGIALAVHTTADETEQYRQAGFGLVLRKPVQHSEITSAISLLSCLPPELSPMPHNGLSASTSGDGP